MRRYHTVSGSEYRNSPIPTRQSLPRGMEGKRNGREWKVHLHGAQVTGAARRPVDNSPAGVAKTSCNAIEIEACA